ncbi:MAG: hypothetical protein QNI99_16615 [Woeseiaceae bacterium]|nr:hypothetical protein [Woeseiaceae bacterium]
MADLADILRIDDKVLEFARDIEVVSALETLMDKYRELKAQLSDLQISDIFEFIDAIENDDELFNALGQTLGQELRDLVGKVSEALGNISEEHRRLLRPLSDFDEDASLRDPGLVNWSILDAGKSGQGAAKFNFSFDVGAGAALAFEAGDSWPPATPGMPDPLLRLGLSGNFRATANASVPLNLGSASASTTNTANAALDYYFDPTDDDELYAAAIATRLDDLCNPMDLDSIWRNVSSSDLRGIVADVDGSTSVQVDVSIAEGFTIAEELAVATADLTVGAKVTRSGEYELVVQAVPATATSSQRLDVSLSRSSLLERGRNLSLGVVVDLSGLAKRLREILKRHLNAFKEVIEEYEEYLTPGTYIRNQLKNELEARVDAAISDAKVQDALKEAFQAALGLTQKPALPKLKSLISDEITEQLDGLGEVVTGKANLVAADVVENIAAKLGIDAADVLASLESEVSTLVNDLKKDLDEKVKSLQGPALDKLKDALDKAGVRVSGAVQTADDALKGVREVIGKYESLLKKLIAHTEDAARTKITARLTHEETRTSGKVVDVQMSITSNTPGAQDAFGAVVRGDMNGIVELLKTTTPGVEFDRDNMSLTRFATLNSRLGFDVVLLGFEFGSQSIFDADAHVTSDGAGRVSVTSNATWTKRRSAPNEEREIEFVDAFELAAASATRQLSIDLSINHLDEKLRVGELRRFLNSFEAAHLLPEGTTNDAINALVEWIGTGEDREIKADVNLGLRLDNKASMRLLQREDRVGGNLRDSSRRNIFAIALRELRDSGAYDLDEQRRLAKAVLTHTEEDDPKTIRDAIYDYTRNVHRRTAGTPTNKKVSSRPWALLTDAFQLHRVCMDFVEFIELMGDIFEATPSLDGSVGWTEEDYLRAQKELSRRIRRWFKIKTDWFLWISDEAHPRTVGFVGALVAMSGVGDDEDAAPALSLSLVRRDGTDDRVTLT